MHALLGLYLRFLHDAARHYFFDIRLSSWLNFLLLLLGLLSWLGVVGGGRGLALACAILALILSLSRRWAQRRYFVHFRPDESPQRPKQEPPLWPDDKLLLRATGHFFVRQKEHDFPNLLAYYRTFETREHAIMARNTPTRVLGLATSNPEIEHMWYIFITPEALHEVIPGELFFGGRPTPALKLIYTRPEKWGEPETGKEVTDIAYLSFDSEEDRRRVHADLLLDLGGPAKRPWRREAQPRD
ncbi:MAG: hypothetical protein GXP42_04985 [Chloroflexi bacterium]|nr:hypothetical protein [Chloroflexota bacterium]